MNRNAKLLIGLACVSSVLTACKDDYFDQEKYDSRLKQSFPVEDVDPNHTWAVYGSAKACIAVAGDASETYTVEVYKEDPTVSKSLTLLATGTASGLNNITLQFSYELASPTVYVSLYNKAGRRWTQKVTATNGGEMCLGFLGAAPPAGRTTRSQSSPSVPDITAPYDATWVSNYLNSATEPDGQNVNDNYDDGKWIEGKDAEWVVDEYVYVTDYETRVVEWGWGWAGTGQTIANGYGQSWFNYKNSGISDEDYNFWVTYCLPYQQQNWGFYGASNKTDAETKLIVDYLRGTGRGSWANVWTEGGTQQVAVGGHNEEIGHWTEPTEGHWQADETFVTNFKIVGTYSGTIPVAASEGYAKNEETGEYGDRLDPFLARTIVVTGTWIITDDQRMGSGSLIVIANGGQVIVSSGKKLETVNHARIVVLSGGILTGPGTVEVSNGNGIGEENYNAGNISVNKFNNNFGKFYNYGKFLVSEYVGGAKESNFYNHGLVHIKYTGLNNETPNARIYNECQWYCENNMRCRIYEGTQGSSFIIGGQLMMSVSADGTSDPTYVGLDDGALVKCGELYNNATSWTGPTSGRAVVSIGKIVYLNWDQHNAPLTYGYFENNIYVEIKDDTNVPEGNADSAGGNTTAGYRFWNIVANGLNGGNAVRGNGGVSKVTENNTNEIIPASDNFSLGSAGCTPGYKGVPDVTEDRVPDNQPKTPQGYRFCFEDQFPHPGDYDFNDCVITVTPVVKGNVATVKISLDAVGASKQLAAAMRIKGLLPTSVTNATNTFTDYAGTYESMRYIAPVKNDKGNTVYYVDPEQLGKDANGNQITDFVVSLFNDAHWVMSRTDASGNDQYMHSFFYNTISKKILNDPRAKTAAPVEMTFTFTLSSEDDAQLFNDIKKYDVFIVEKYSGRLWEVHTYPFKFDQVLEKWANYDVKLTPYVNSATKNYPWAIQVPGDFLYPVEWQSISGAKIQTSDADNFGIGTAAYPLFKWWAVNPNVNDAAVQQWYLRENIENEDLVWQ